MKRFLSFNRSGDPEPGSGPRAAAGPKPVAEGHASAGREAPLAAGVPLGIVVPRRIVADPHLIVLHDPSSPIAERFRRIKLNIERGARHGEPPRQVVLVTSATPEEGKTTTAMNLALAMAEDKDHSVVVVDADLRRPALSRFVTPEPTLGLAEILSGRLTLDHALVTVRESRVAVLPSGTPMPNPLALLRSGDLGRVFAELRARFDRVVVDTPPTVPFTDAAVLQAHTDGALLVVRAAHTARPMVAKAMESLASGVFLGVVLNDVPFTPVDRYYYRYDEHRYYKSDRRDDGEGDRK